MIWKMLNRIHSDAIPCVQHTLFYLASATRDSISHTAPTQIDLWLVWTKCGASRPLVVEVGEEVNASSVTVARSADDEAIHKWRPEEDVKGVGFIRLPPKKEVFFWNGFNIVLQISSKLNFLALCPELVEWYGLEFPFVRNPFARAVSLDELRMPRGINGNPQDAVQNPEFKEFWTDEIRYFR